MRPRNDRRRLGTIPVHVWCKNSSGAYRRVDERVCRVNSASKDSACYGCVRWTDPRYRKFAGTVRERKR